MVENDDGGWVDPLHSLTGSASVNALHGSKPPIHTMDLPIDDSGADEALERLKRNKAALFGKPNNVTSIGKPIDASATQVADVASTTKVVDAYAKVWADEDDPVTMPETIAGLQRIGFGFVPLPTNKKSPPIKGKFTWPEAIKRTNILTTLKNAGTRNAAMTPPPGVVLLDVDDDVPPLLAEKTKTLGALPETLKVITPNGMHVAYRWPEHLARPQGDFWDAVVVRWDFRTSERGGGYTVAPGSYWDGLGADGTPVAGKKAGTYTLWVDAEHDPLFIATLPEAWAQDVLAASEVTGTNVPVGDGPLADVPRIGPNRRHDWLRDRARYLAGLGLRGDKLFNAIYDLYEARCEPYGAGYEPAAEVRRAIGDVSQFQIDDESSNGTDVHEETAGHAAVDVADIKVRSMLDLPIPAVVEPLVEVMHPESLTVLYGKGGTGKGNLSVYLALEAASEGKRVLVLDYEGHQGEWASRMRYLAQVQFDDEALGLVSYLAPQRIESGMPMASFMKMADVLAKVVREGKYDLVVIDSIGLGACLGHDIKDEQTPVLFQAACQRLGVPVLALSHIKKEARETETDYPFGSVYWHNAARATWYATSTLADDGVTLLSLRCNKFNDAGMQGQKLGYRVRYRDGRLIEVRPTLSRAAPGQKSITPGNRMESVEDVLTRAGVAVEEKYIVDATGLPRMSVRRLLAALVADGRVLIESVPVAGGTPKNIYRRV